MRISIPVGSDTAKTAELWIIKNDQPILWAAGSNYGGAKGKVFIEYDEAPSEAGYEIFFKFYFEEKMIYQTPSHAADLSTSYKLQADFYTELSEKLANPPKVSKSNTVAGVLVQPDGTPLANHYIVAVDKEANGEKIIGAAFSWTNGKYTLYYETNNLSRPEKTRADLQIRVFANNQSEEVLITSPLILNALAAEEINLSIGDEPYRGKTEWLQLLENVGGDREMYEVGNWTDEQTILLANQHDFSETQIANYIRAWQLSTIIDMDGQILYGFLQQGLSKQAAGLAGTLKSVLEEAVKKAVEANIIDKKYGLYPELVEQSIHILEDRFPDLAINSEEYDRDKSELGRLLLASGLTDDEARQFLYDYKNNEDSMPEFWEKTKTKFGDRSEIIEQLQLRLQLNAITNNNETLVTHLITLFNLADAQDLIKLKESDWQSALSGEDPLIEIPEGVEGDTLEERRTAYIKIMRQILQDGFSTAALHYELNQDDEVNSAYIDRFFEKNPEFDLSAVTFEAFLDKKPNALEGVVNARRVKEEMRAFEKTHQLLPKDRVRTGFKTLWQNKITDFRSITQMGRAKFIGLFPEGEEYQKTARETFNEAQRRQAVTAQMLISFGSAQFQTPMRVTSNEGGIADWDTLFGDGDYCACQHCRSVLSPSAYLVDLLTFLNQARANSNYATDAGIKNALHELLERRPDIGNILLNCENSHTEMPYLDLVMEVLENEISPDAYERVRLFGEDLFVKVNKNKQTNDTSSDLDTYPEHLKPEVYEQLIRQDGETAAYPWRLPFDIWQKELSLLLEKLKVDRSALVYLLKKGTTQKVQALLNLSPEEYEAMTEIGSSDEGRKKLWGMVGESGSWFNKLTVPKTFLKHSGVDFPTLEKLSKLNFFKDPETGEGLRLNIVNCSLEDPNSRVLGVHLNNNLQKIPTFIRLQKKLGWSYEELDTVLRVMNFQNLDKDVIHQLSLIQRLRNQFTSLKLPELLTWFRPLDTYASDGEPSFYEKRFLNRLSLRSGGEIFQLNEDKTELAVDTLNIFDEKINALLSGILGLEMEDFQLLKAASVLASSRLNLHNLSRLWQISSFCKTLRISVSEYIDWSRLNGRELVRIPEFPAHLLDNVKLILENRNIGLDAAFFNWIIFDEDADRQPEDAAATLIAFLENLRILLINASLRKEETGLDTGKETKEEKEEREAQEKSVFEKRLQILYTNIGSHFELSPAVVESFLREAKIGEDALLDIFLQADMLQIETDENGEIINKIAKLSNLLEACKMFRKLAICSQRMEISDEILLFVFQHGTAHLLPIFTAIPEIPAEPDNTFIRANLYRWHALSYLQKAVQAAGGNSQSLLNWLAEISIVEQIEQEEFVSNLSQIMNWEEANLAGVLQSDLLGWHFPDPHTNLTPLNELMKIMELLHRTKVAPALLAQWAEASISPTCVHETRNLLKSKYSEAAYRQIMTPIRNQLREEQRDVLLAKLLTAKNKFHKVGDIYRHFLIDPEMGACMKTSRTVQAIAAVQLFVQRIMIGLEPAFYLDPEDAEEWEWRKNYRVWEANRKVFLYPENWIEPELRDDKSPFFKELETELLQGEVTNERAEEAYRNYLYKLNEVARPEVVALYEEDDETLHVIGRTQGSPNIYYYRKRLSNQYWTAWERVNLELGSEQLLLIVYNNRLYLFWLSFVDKGEKMHVNLNWTIYKNGSWESQKINPHAYVPMEIISFDSADYYYLLDEDKIYLQSHIDEDNNLAICIFANDIQVAGRSYIINHLSSKFEPYQYQNFKSVQDSSFELKSMKYFLPSSNNFTLYAGRNLLNLTEKRKITVTSTHQDAITGFKAGESDTGVLAYKSIHKFYNRPFFYEDKEHTFFVNSADAYKKQTNSKSNDNLAKEKLTINSGVNKIKQFSEAKTVSKLQRTVNQSDTIKSPYFNRRQANSVVSRTNDNNRGFGQMALLSADPQQPKKDNINIAPWAELLGYRFEKFYHPFTPLLINTITKYGINGIFKSNAPNELSRQKKTNQFFENDYQPNTKFVQLGYPIDDFDFSYVGSYSLYNWEFFFHIPLMIAVRLSQNQKFAEAQKWFHYIFNPLETKGEIPKRYWKIKPFYEYDSVTSIEDLLSKTDKDLEAQIEAWEEDPFNPHLIARMRVFSYMRATVMKYLDNLIAWGDYLFQRDTRESVNEATQIYLLAADLLGDKPIKLPKEVVNIETFNELINRLDDFNNAVVDITRNMTFLGKGSRIKSKTPVNIPTTHYFCIPQNEKLSGYWSLVADRLFKIRNCMNIEGITRKLALFQPPIDPALLVKARAYGLDIASVLDGLSAPTSFYRFSTLLQFANQLVNDVKTLGNTFLGTLEKKDAEALSQLRSDHEIRLLQEVRDMKRQAIEQAKKEIEALKKTEATTKFTSAYFKNKEKHNRREKESILLDRKAHGTLEIGRSLDIAASAVATIPQFSFPKFSWSYGGQHISSALRSIAEYYKMEAAGDQYNSSRVSKLASYDWRYEDWQYQADLAEKQLAQIEKQIAAAEIRKAIAETDLKNHDLQTEQAIAVQDYLKNKYTNEQLYSWMIGQLSTTYFQTYQLAFDMAKKAERQMAFELGVDKTTDIIQFGHWDNLKKGLLAGEKLQYDLRRLEAAYYEQNKRAYEITKHVSLRQLDPVQLLKLRATGECDVVLPEWLYDMDCPGHYNRRIKTVAVSIPAIAGPYTGVNCTLSMTENSVRISALADGDYARKESGDARFKSYYSNVQSIVTSSGQNDSGLFEVNLRDERYLPFEGMGAISKWSLKLPKTARQFDYNSISDVILHIRYTAKEAGGLREAAQEHYLSLAKTAENTPLRQLFSLKHDFPQAWRQFKKSEEGNFKAMIKKDHFPYLAQAGKLGDFQIQLYAVKRENTPEPLPLESIAQQSLEDLNETREGVIEIDRDSVINLEAEELFLIVGYTCGMS